MADQPLCMQPADCLLRRMSSYWTWAHNSIWCIYPMKVTNKWFFALLMVVFASGYRGFRSTQREVVKAFSSSSRTPQRLKLDRGTLRSASTDGKVEIDTPDTMPKSFKSPFLQTLLERGFIHQCTDFKGLDEKFESGTVSAYLGFDATANSLHVGSLLQVPSLTVTHYVSISSCALVSIFHRPPPIHQDFHRPILSYAISFQQPAHAFIFLCPYLDYDSQTPAEVWPQTYRADRGWDNQSRRSFG